MNFLWYNLAGEENDPIAFISCHGYELVELYLQSLKINDCQRAIKQ